MLPRFHVQLNLAKGLRLALPASVARHVQVLRLQPGSALTLFNDDGLEWVATVAAIGRTEVQVDIGDSHSTDRELRCTVTLAVGMPANDRMDWLIEKCAELGATAIQPLMTARSVLKLDAARATKRVAHWQAVAIAACEQCGRTVVPAIAPVMSLEAWLALRPLATQTTAQEDTLGIVLSPSGECELRDRLTDFRPTNAGRPGLVFLSGPEGGLTAEEEAAARSAGFMSAQMGPRILRADTAPLAALVTAGLLFEPSRED